MCDPYTLLPGGLVFIWNISLVLPGTVYGGRGLDLGECNMKCPQRSGVLLLVRTCTNSVWILVEVHCDNLTVRSNPELRTHLNTSSGCRTMMNTTKDDSCLYRVWYDGRLPDPTHSYKPVILQMPIRIPEHSQYFLLEYSLEWVFVFCIGCVAK